VPAGEDGADPAHDFSFSAHALQKRLTGHGVCAARFSGRRLRKEAAAGGAGYFQAGFLVTHAALRCRSSVLGLTICLRCGEVYRTKVSAILSTGVKPDMTSRRCPTRHGQPRAAVRGRAELPASECLRAIPLSFRLVEIASPAVAYWQMSLRLA